MWTRQMLKERGRETFKANYWKAVLAALILTMVSGGAGSSISSSLNLNMNNGLYYDDSDYDDYDYAFDDYDAYDEYDDYDDYDEYSDTDELDLDDYSSYFEDEDDSSALGFAFAGIGLAVGLIVVVAVLAVSAILLNPIEVGCKRFFLANLYGEAQLNSLGFAFKNGWKNASLTLLIRDIKLFLWSLLFIIPGLVKSYEYRMVPYLLADQPEMDRKEAFAASKEMMSGQKWNTFVLDLSFLGWELLSICTCGILSIFWVNPYKYSTDAALYDTLRYGGTAPEITDGREEAPQAAEF